MIMTIVTGNQLAILVRTLDMLKHLTDKQGVLHVFELQALKELSRNFQTCAAQKSENGALSIVLGAFYSAQLTRAGTPCSSPGVPKRSSSGRARGRRRKMRASARNTASHDCASVRGCLIT